MILSCSRKISSLIYLNSIQTMHYDISEVLDSAWRWIRHFIRHITLLLASPFPYPQVSTCNRYQYYFFALEVHKLIKNSLSLECLTSSHIMDIADVVRFIVRDPLSAIMNYLLMYGSVSGSLSVGYNSSSKTCCGSDSDMEAISSLYISSIIS